MSNERHFVIIGAGPAGLAAAYELTRQGISPTVVEKSGIVGGLSRTEQCQGFYFDMGGHRFFSKSAEVNDFWREVLGEDFLLRPRLSRIYYNQTFFHYPLKPWNALLGLGIWQSILVAASYLRWQLFPYKKERTFEQWVTNRFGKRLFSIFFKAYTEKVWGISTSELSSEWAAQRIKDLDLKAAVLNMFYKPKTKAKTLIEQFNYPRLGPGMMWERVRSIVEEKNGHVLLNSAVTAIHHTGTCIDEIEVDVAGRKERIMGTDFISSMPITDFIKVLDPPPPEEVLRAANNLTYRDFLTVCLVVNQSHLFDDNWIYVHDPGVKVGRIQNFKNWSSDMVPDQTKTSLGLEYFCNQGDELWCMTDEELIELGRKELQKIGLVEAQDVELGCVFRMEKAYPVWDSTYAEHLATLQKYIEKLENFQTIGRNGMHRYNNQDHSMLTGMYAVRNALSGAKHDLWVVNADKEYHEIFQDDMDVSGQKVEEVMRHTFSQAFWKLDPGAFGLAWGTTLGLLWMFLTLVVARNHMESVGDKMFLLSQFFPVYAISAPGSLMGLIYGFGVGFLLGWFFAFLRNAGIILSMAIIHREAQLKLLRKLIEF